MTQRDELGSGYANEWPSTTVLLNHQNNDDCDYDIDDNNSNNY